jgi:uncharacterized protein (TIGR02147 family)
MAKAAQMQSSNLSQVFNSDKHLSLDQAEAVASFFEMNESESDYFLLLVMHDRAATNKFRARIQRQIALRRSENLQLSKRLSSDGSFSDADRALFYGNWYYNAIQILTFIPEFRTIDAITKKLNIPRPIAQEAIRFLIRSGLCTETPNGLVPGTKHTHLEASSPLATHHHANWRIKAMERYPLISRTKELGYTSQMALSRDDAERVRAMCMKLIEEIRAVVDPSPSQAVYCLNLDWFELGG